MYYKSLQIKDWQRIYDELEPIYLSKIPAGAGVTREDSFTMFTVEELSSSPTLVSIIKDLGLYEYWQPGPIITTGPYKAIPIHMDYNLNYQWSSNELNSKVINACNQFDIFKYQDVRRETILFPIHNCENSVSYFYELKPGKSTKLLQTHQGLYYHIAEYQDVEECASFVLTEPTIFNITKLHTAVNFSNKIRVTLSVRFLPCEEFNRIAQQ